MAHLPQRSEKWKAISLLSSLPEVKFDLLFEFLRKKFTFFYCKSKKLK